MEKEHAKKKRERIPEIDFLRGLALLLMVWHHAMYDVRYIFGIDAFAFQDSYWFYRIGRPIVLALFLLVSGISTRFSGNNLKRGLRMLLFAVIATVLTAIVEVITNWMGVIFFNVFHVIALSTLCYVLIEHLFIGRYRASPDGILDVELSERPERKPGRPVMNGILDVELSERLERKPGRSVMNGILDVERQKAKMIGFLIGFGAFAVAIGYVIAPILPNVTRNPLFVILGSPVAGVQTLDQLPLFPYLGYFLLGSAIGQTLYASGEPFWKGERGLFHTVGRPIRFMGRHALFVYLFHQPVLLSLLWLLSQIGLF
ncbi:MAG: DUF1624 domain-containing protein [Clostridiaceae bacterium]|nr:DUF1624 domain-containing protein [Clostridiaceae bacterium]